VHAEQALRLVPSDPRALELRGVLRNRSTNFVLSADGLDSDSVILAERDLQSAVAKDSTRAKAWAELSSIHLSRGHLPQAKFAAEQAYAADSYLDEVYEVLDRLFLTSFELGDDAAARRWCDETRRRVQQSELYARCALTLFAWTEAAKPDPDAAWRIVEITERDALPQMRADVRQRLESLVAAVLARAGMADSARAVIERARPGTMMNPEILHLEAAAWTLLKEPSRAIRLLAEYQRLVPSTTANGLISRRFQSLRGEPGYQSLIAAP
jgi:hypothetical protein